MPAADNACESLARGETEYALAGADFVSVGALTHSVAAADIALELD